MAIGEHEVRALAVQAIELVHVAAAASRPDPFTRVAECHASTGFRHGLRLRVLVLGVEHRIGDRTDPGCPAELVRSFAASNCFTSPVGYVAHFNLAIAKEHSVTVDAGLGGAEHSHVI